jgi:ABC-type sugar transport system permease subunit
VAADPLVRTAFVNTFYYAVLSLGLTFFIPIFVSILLMEMKPGRFRAMMILWFLPIASDRQHRHLEDTSTTRAWAC